MNDRRQAGLLAFAGAVVLAIGCWLPYNSQGSLDYQVFQRHGYSGQLYYAVEPAAVIVAAGAIGLLLLRGPLPAVWAGALIAMGCQTVLLWVGYIGYSLTANFAVHIKEGGWIGMVGAVGIALGGVAALRASWTPSGAVTPAGWYDDPRHDGQLRYWSGSFWTDHTAARPAGL